MESGRADVLVVAKLDRMSRSLLDFANLMARAQVKGWNPPTTSYGGPRFGPARSPSHPRAPRVPINPADKGAPPLD